MTTLNVLFLCTGNSARSILGEMAANTHHSEKFLGFSAGSNPVGSVNPYALKIAETLNYDVSKLRSKSLEEISTELLSIDFVVTVCDNAAAEVCPILPTEILKVHWSYKDPARVSNENDENKLKAFQKIYEDIYKKLTTIADKIDNRFDLSSAIKGL